MPDGADKISAVGISGRTVPCEVLGCKALVLACNGFGGNAALVRQHIPEIADGLYYGHQGNTGDALVWGQTLGARHRTSVGLSGPRLAGASAWHPDFLGADDGRRIQVNTEGVRFSNEHGGYSEQAVNVLAQPDGIAWNIYDARLHAFAQGFPDYREAMAAGAVRQAADVTELARVTGLPEAALSRTLSETALYQSGQTSDPFGRDFTGKPVLTAPYHAVKVTGALFHTQGGLMIDDRARVVREDGARFANLFAGGGAACGVSGPDVSGYLSGNGLLTAIAFGFLAGTSAGELSAPGSTSDTGS
jgi:fumarate reductase flavoprotein subunit